jgi:hypothetical protein
MGLLAGISRLFKGKSAGDNAPEQAAAAPKTAVAETTAPAQAAPETAVAETAVAETETDKAEAAAPETAVAETAAPETAVAETAAPETAVAETAAPETAVAETAAPETAVAEETPAAADTKDAAASVGAADLPLADYDTLTIAQVRARLRNLTVLQLERLVEFEKANAGRADYVAAFENRIAKVKSGK